MRSSRPRAGVASRAIARTSDAAARHAAGLSRPHGARLLRVPEPLARASLACRLIMSSTMAVRDGAQYAPTGPEALTVNDAADVIADVSGRPAKHNDIDRDAWIDGSVAAGVPAEYGERLRMLTETIASGHGSRPNNDVQNVTGVPPISFADFARRTAQAWA
jgi:uncharacterized protein YbjT (DUF2867 family)